MSKLLVVYCTFIGVLAGIGLGELMRRLKHGWIFPVLLIAFTAFTIYWEMK